MKLGEIARRLGCELEGTGDIDITGVRGLEEAGATELSFVSNRKYIPKIKTTRAAALILGRDLPNPKQQSVIRPVLWSDDPYTAFARALELFYQPPRPAPGIHPTAVVAPTAKLGRNASIGPYVVIEDDVEIGDDAVLKSFVVIYQGARIGHRFLAHSHAVVREFCRLGDDVILQNGAVVGCDGYGFAKQPDGSYYKIVAAGNDRARGPCGDSGERLPGPRHGGRDSHPRRSEDRQPGAGGSQLGGGREFPALRAGGTGRVNPGRTQLHPDGSGGRGGPLHAGR